MKIFIAGLASPLSVKSTGYAFQRFVGNRGLNWLDSYYYLRKLDPVTAEWFSGFRKTDKCREFLLDSGAFTFMSGTNKQTNLDEYVEGFCKFITDEKIEKFFELDIDCVIGYENVLEIRERIERLTGKKCIPVWHKSRGIEEFKQMCQDYEYVSIGGIVSREISKKQLRLIGPKLIQYAHKQGCKIHGLGLGKPLMTIHDFDSVDSTSWSSGIRYGAACYKFDGRDLKRIKFDTPKKGHRDRQVDNAIEEWMKYADFMEFDYKGA